MMPNGNALVCAVKTNVCLDTDWAANGPRERRRSNCNIFWEATL